MNRLYRYTLIVLAAMSLTACDKLVQTFVNPDDYDFLSDLTDKPQPTMEVSGVTFSPDYKTFTVTTNMLREVSEYELADSAHIRVEVVETIDGLRRTHLSTPKLVGMRNMEAEGILENDVRMLVLVDLSAPQSELNRARNFVGSMQTIFVKDNLYVAFMDGEKVSRTMKVTEYVLNNHFRQSSNHYIFLYRSMLQKMQEMTSHQGVWKDADKLVMVTIAADQVYNNDSDTPIDPEHYKYEDLLLRPNTDNSFLSYYVSLAQQHEQDDHEVNIPWLFSNNSGGAYMHADEAFTGVSLKRKIYEAFQFDFPDNEFYFVNPDFKVYRGDLKQLSINFYDIKADSLIASASTTVTMGEVYRPIIVHGHKILYVILQGLILGLLLFALIYCTLQFIVPFVSYLIFKRKYVVSYAGANMSVRQTPVSESCYLCKAPFRPGDEIVVKCEHTVHKSCWDENGYHCPEYSDRCKHGSHYYNHHNQFDHHNAPYYMKWVLVAVVAATLSWLCFILDLHYDLDPITHHFMRPPASQVPSFGFAIGLFLTGALSAYTVADDGKRYVLQITLRALAGAIGCYLSFLFTNTIILLLDIEEFVSILNVLPWAASSFIIVYCATNVTRVAHNNRMVIVSIVLGVLSMFASSLFYQRSELDYRVLILLSFVIYCICMAVSIAHEAPHTERYFLKVEGAVKTMDIALYKWFRNNSDKVVTIGKSVDCSLQLSWDIRSEIAPVQAEIRLVHNIPYLIALEAGVLRNGKALLPGKRQRLYHGCTFSIGQTTFTYIEKDR